MASWIFFTSHGIDISFRTDDRFLIVSQERQSKLGRFHRLLGTIVCAPCLKPRTSARSDPGSTEKQSHIIF